MKDCFEHQLNSQISPGILRIRRPYAKTTLIHYVPEDKSH